ncbi:MAG: T9SS type A sorting domain-containing protein [Owenweeksia sp.]|nr:T9SS type A sorting domain-containing protein [Owenweeksia sp.]
MKKLLLSLSLSFFMTAMLAQSSHLITASGNNYTPDTIVAQVGDTIKFNVGSAHPTVEVNSATWNSNAATPLGGGFDFPSGDGSFVIGQAKTYYYVCETHISSGMKGVIIANTVGAENERILSEINLYPNPVDTELRFELLADPGIESATIINPMGQKMMKIQMDATTPSQSINVEKLTPGAYFLLIKQGNTSKELRFVKQ